MIPPYQKLSKFLKLESERNYDNRAVFGGLHHFANTWLTETQVFAPDQETIKTIHQNLVNYVNMDRNQRAEAVKQIFNLMGMEEPIPPVHAASHRPSVEKPSIHPPRSAEKQPGQPVRAVEKHPAVITTPVRQPLPRQLPVKSHGDETPLGIYAPINTLYQIGPKNAELYNKLGIYNILDLLYYFPRRYVDYSQLKPINRLQVNDTVTVMATVVSTQTRAVKGGKMKLTECIVSDGSGSLRLSWFNQPWLQNTLQEGVQITASGKLELYLGRLMINNPEWELLNQEHLHTNRIVPIYPLTTGISSKILRKVLNYTIGFWAPRIEDFLPDYIKEQANLTDISQALQKIHFPDCWEDLKDAERRLAFDEIFLLQLGVIRQKTKWQLAEGQKFICEDEFINPLVAQLPYQFTGAQWRIVNEIRHDLYSGQAMNRLIQGDVGSGKTVVAAMAIAIIVRAKAQAAYMAPTSILAEQQYRTLLNILSSGENAVLKSDEIRLLIGDVSESEKEEIRLGLQEGTIKLIVGTHALIEGPILFQNLQMVVIDEQHRFGVEQRALLRTKGNNPHLLVMTATPIPRSLALTLYGDLDVSVLDEIPKGRLPIKTHIVHPADRNRAYGLIQSQIEQGHQAFIIYPLVEQGDNDEIKAAVEESEQLQKAVFPHLKIGLLHGRMKPEEKDRVMTDFKNHSYDILVSTSVVEVGVDIPNATVMLVEGANRFGLAQLHQFRGRVGRGEAQSYCLLVPENEQSLDNERLIIMSETSDGFVLAEKDLEQRGPGDFLGTRQAGFMELRMANITDTRLIEEARKHAGQILEQDPELSHPNHQALRKMLARFWKTGEGDIS